MNKVDPRIVAGLTPAQNSILDQVALQKYYVNVKEFGAKGDGVTDDTKAIQDAMNAASGSRLEIPKSFVCRITSQITMPSNIVIDIKGKVLADGDVNYWFYSKNADKIIFENIEVEVVKKMTPLINLNRVIFCDSINYLEVRIADIKGAYTSIHCLNGNTLNCGKIFLKNVTGINAQYGYGINSSAKVTTIDQLFVENESESEGRHAIYINGSQWEKVHINYLNVKNFNKNPVNIANTNIDAKATLTIVTAIFDNVNVLPTVDSTGCIHGGDENGPGIRIQINFIKAKRIGGPVVGSQGTGADYFSVDHIQVDSLLPAAFVNSYVVNFRGGKYKYIGKLVCPELNTNWLAGIYIRDVVNASVEDLYVGGTVGSQALRLNNASVTLGTILTEALESTYQTGSTIKYKNAKQNIDYRTSPPTSGTYKQTDMVYNTNPLAGSYMGWVCTVAGSPGTWKGFGLIQA